MPVPILSTVPLVRVRWIRTQNNTAVASDTVTATPTVTYLTVPGVDGGHGFIDPLKPVVSQVDGNVGYVDIVPTDDAQVVEDFGWTFTFQGSTRPARTVSVPQSGQIVETLTLKGGETILAVWLDDLADFTGTSGVTGNQYAPFSYVDDSIAALQDASDPFPQYALDGEAGGGGTSAFVQWAADPDALIVGAITRDANGAATSAPVVWPDGTPGTYTATTLSTAFPGAVDAYTVTYGSPVTKTYTQPAVTRDATSGAVTVRPAIEVT